MPGTSENTTYVMLCYGHKLRTDMAVSDAHQCTCIMQLALGIPFPMSEVHDGHHRRPYYPYPTVRRPPPFVAVVYLRNPHSP
jgi:hypothetical protein